MSHKLVINKKCEVYTSDQLGQPFPKSWKANCRNMSSHCFSFARQLQRGQPADLIGDLDHLQRRQLWHRHRGLLRIGLLLRRRQRRRRRLLRRHLQGHTPGCRLPHLCRGKRGWSDWYFHYGCQLRDNLKMIQYRRSWLLIHRRVWAMS